MIYTQVLYILISSLTLYVLYQLMVATPPSDDNEKTQGGKVQVYLCILAACTVSVFYFEIGVDQLQRGGETKLRDVLQFEKSMINNIRQDVDVGQVPF